MTDAEKQQAEVLISNLELALGEVFMRHRDLAPLTKEMSAYLRALRSLLGLVKPH
jgi:hypothetical protein